jgi:hypothetical protein
MTEGDSKKPNPWLMLLVPAALGAFVLHASFGIGMDWLDADMDREQNAGVEDTASRWVGSGAADCGTLDADTARREAVVACVEAALAAKRPMRATLVVDGTRHVLAVNSVGKVLRLTEDPDWAGTQRDACDEIVTRRGDARGIWCRNVRLSDGARDWFPPQ